MKYLTKIAVLGAISAAAFGAQASLLIDDFNTATMAVSAPPGVTGLAFGTSSGGYVRSLTTTTVGAFLDTAINSSSTPGKLSHSQGAGVTGESNLSYALSVTGLDLTEAGLSNAFRLQLDTVDLNILLGVRVFDGVNSASISLNSLAIVIANLGVLPSYVDFLFSGFAGVDMTSVDSVTLLIDGRATASVDATVDNFGTVCSANTVSGGSGANPSIGICGNHVPEPDALALVGLALIGLSLTRRATRRA